MQEATQERAVQAREPSVPSAAADEGIATVWMRTSRDVARTTIEEAAALARELKTETLARVGATLDWLEGFATSGFRVARHVTAATARIVDEVVGGSEATALAVVAVADRAGRGVTVATSDALLAALGRNGSSVKLGAS